MDQIGRVKYIMLVHSTSTWKSMYSRPYRDLQTREMRVNSRKRPYDTTEKLFHMSHVIFSISDFRVLLVTDLRRNGKRVFLEL